MSTEKIVSTEINDLPHLATPNKSEEASFSRRVDINDLLARVREEKKKENKINLVFFCMFATLIVTVGLILSF
mgnify:FL=1|tara:strand:- start:249 stop:467 length:219 start_codon:yes stop_codon:yes gene_type:complete